MQTRPRIKLILPLTDRILEWAGNILLVILWSVTLYSFYKLPTTIPIHFNALGEVDNYGSKATLFILPVVATFLYFGLTFLNRYPHIFNYPTEITEANVAKQYLIATRMLRFVKVGILLVFSVIVLFTYLTAIGVTTGLGAWFLPLMFVVFIVPLIFLISQSLKKK